MPETRIDTLYRPNFEESSRQNFVAALKGYVNGPMERQLAAQFSEALIPEFESENARPPESLEEATQLFEGTKLYQLWASMVYSSQDLLWETVGLSVDRLRPDFEELAQGIEPEATLGSLKLNSEISLPSPIATTEIHRQPGGYFYASGSQDLTAPLQYFASIELYRKAKGLSVGAKTGEPGMTRFMVKALKGKFGDLKPKRILDLGCAIGVETIGLKEAFPDAEIHGLDLSAPFLRFAHVWAENNQVPVHYRQADARATGYDDGYFDLIVSHILFHETWDDILPSIMTEAQRILAPGGVFFNADVPYQADRTPMTKQVTNAWQVVNNGEPFWAGFLKTDISTSLRDAGFKSEDTFEFYEPLGAGDYYLFGAKKS